MKSVHKSVKGLKRNGILLLLFDLGILAFAVTKNVGLVFQTSVLNDIVLDFVLAIVIDALWVFDSQIWITDKKTRTYLWMYIIVKCVLLLSICGLTLMGQAAAASILVYMLGIYCVVGISFLMFL